MTATCLMSNRSRDDRRSRFQSSIYTAQKYLCCAECVQLFANIPVLCSFLNLSELKCWITKLDRRPKSPEAPESYPFPRNVQSDATQASQRTYEATRSVGSISINKCTPNTPTTYRKFALFVLPRNDLVLGGSGEGSF